MTKNGEMDYCIKYDYGFIQRKFAYYIYIICTYYFVYIYINSFLHFKLHT